MILFFYILAEHCSICIAQMRSAKSFVYSLVRQAGTQDRQLVSTPPDELENAVIVFGNGTVKVQG